MCLYHHRADITTPLFESPFFSPSFLLPLLPSPPSYPAMCCSRTSEFCHWAWSDHMHTCNPHSFENSQLLLLPLQTKGQVGEKAKILKKSQIISGDFWGRVGSFSLLGTGISVSVLSCHSRFPLNTHTHSCEHVPHSACGASGCLFFNSCDFPFHAALWPTDLNRKLKVKSEQSMCSFI